MIHMPTNMQDIKYFQLRQCTQNFGLVKNTNSKHQIYIKQ